MSFHRRIRTIYGKELTDILRDRRTLIAMIVVPIVLYPLLMLGSIQAVTFQVESMEREYQGRRPTSSDPAKSGARPANATISAMNSRVAFTPIGTTVVIGCPKARLSH